MTNYIIIRHYIYYLHAYNITINSTTSDISSSRKYRPAKRLWNWYVLKWLV